MSEIKPDLIKVLKPVEIAINDKFKVVHGVPTKIDSPLNSPGVEGLTVPNEPHIFNVDELTVSHKSHSKRN